MKTDLIINEGFASGINDGILGQNKKTISHYALPIILRHLGDDLGDWMEVWSTRIRSRRMMRRFVINRIHHSPINVRNLIIICKSMGVVEVYDLLETMWEVISHYNHIGLVCIDGHSKLLKDLFRRRYGRKRSFIRYTTWSLEKITIFNYYQRNKYPEGARFIGADYELEIKDPVTNHFSIIYHPEVLDGIHTMCNCILEENIDCISL